MLLTFLTDKGDALSQSVSCEALAAWRSSEDDKRHEVVGVSSLPAARQLGVAHSLAELTSDGCARWIPCRL